VRARRRWLALTAAALVVLAVTPKRVAAQANGLFPDRSLMPRLLAAQNEAMTAAKLVVAPTTPSLFGTILEGEATFGAVLPLYRIAGTTPQDAIVLGVEGGVVGRFNLETRERDLITSDWIFGLPVVVHRGPHWFRARYFHTSAHFGDEYLERFAIERVPSAFDALEFTGYLRPLASFGLYGGGRWSFRVDPPDTRRWAVQGGAEVEAQSGTIARPFAAGDVELDQLYGWTPRITVQAGAHLRAPAERPAVRIAVEFMTGPSPQGQFEGARTTHITLGAIIDF
jgi:hypothetical protein